MSNSPLEKPSLSWSAIEFLAKPSSRILKLATIILVGSIVGFVIASFFIEKNQLIQVTGEVTSDRPLINVWPRSTGMLTSLAVEIGSEVEKDQVVATLDLEPSTIASLKQTESEFLKLASQLADANSKFQFNESKIPNVSTLGLADSEAINAMNKVLYEGMRFKNERTAVRRTELVNALRVGAASLQSLLQRSEVVSPVKGKIVRIFQTVGAKVSENESFVTIEPVDAKLVSILSVPAKWKNLIQKDQTVLYQVDSSMSERTELVSGSVLSVGSVLEQGSNASGPYIQAYSSVEELAKHQANVFGRGMKFHASIVVGRQTLFKFATQKFMGL